MRAIILLSWSSTLEGFKPYYTLRIGIGVQGAALTLASLWMRSLITAGRSNPTKSRVGTNYKGPLEEESRRSNLQAQGYFRMTENMGSDEARPRRPPYLPACLKAARPLSPFFGALHSRSNIPLAPPSLFADRPPFSCMRRVPLFPPSVPRLPFFNPISHLIFSLLTFCSLPRSLPRARRRDRGGPPEHFTWGCSKRLEEASEEGRKGIRGHKRTR